MKKVTINLILMISLSTMVLAGCSTNTQQQNTTVGAVAGAVVGGLAGSAIGAGTGRAVAIAAGAVIGGLFGGYVGHSMDHTDNYAMNHALENNPKGKTSSWTNKKTGASVSVTPTTNRMAYKGHSNCREFHSTATYQGKRQSVDGVACRGSNGLWRTVAKTG